MRIGKIVSQLVNNGSYVLRFLQKRVTSKRSLFRVEKSVNF